MSKTKLETVADDSLDKEQRCFDMGVKCCNLLVKPENLYKLATKQVMKLHLKRSLPRTISFSQLLKNLSNLQILDLSYNNMGPQAFRAVCLAMCSNITITSLNLADNRTDTDTSACIGKMVQENGTLQYLDVSGNSLGKDYFSRCVGPALKTNTSLTRLKAQSIGIVDVNVLLEGLKENKTITELDLSSNQVTDRRSLGEGLNTVLKNVDCKLSSLCLCNCDINSDGIKLLLDGLQLNKSLVELNLSGNEFEESELLYNFLVSAFQHDSLSHLYINDARISNTSLTSEVSVTSSTISSMTSLKLNSSKITNQMLSFLGRNFCGKLCNLLDLDISNNNDLKPECLQDIVKLTQDAAGNSSLQKLTFGLNECDSIAENLQTQFPNLEYLNLRKARMSVEKLEGLSIIVKNKGLQISTLVLDGLKLSGTEAMKSLNAALSSSNITALSFDGCSLADKDMLQLFDAMNAQLKLHMLKLSANRFTDELITQLVMVLLKKTDYPLAVLDVSNNELCDPSPIEISKLYLKKGSSLHSINLHGNNIGKCGVLSLISCLGPNSTLKTLYMQNQSKALEESEVIEIGLKLADCLGYKVNNKDGMIEIGCSDLPTLPDGFLVNISGLGGTTGDIGYKLDCQAIITDLSTRQLLNLSFSDIMELASSLKGYDNCDCILSMEEFSQITGANKDREVPSWLQVSGKRELALYLSNLPGNATVNKIEALFDMEADCSVDEVCLMKDPVTRCNNGVGWVLMCDETSVNKAVDFFHQGEAKVFGQPFMISRIKVRIEDNAGTEAERKARQDMEERLRQRKKDDAAHRQLIQHNTEESWKRHAYRLAHPAYADGRIW
ncbi:uncharacterized protein LOC126817009 isoform X1 [Patella vulgata]|uniref:uncharacterized protein LOC126817009 isoform X1 n=2 Tax=Patella vulgata TaxID=6465 RepID=UPI0024A97EC7|nr:uncharacterized protein LOC126817009 isoform X1 [Patella vulgata]XP_055955857.1 uncharacterized protein LOC126817009 isoform X1 [Patella vulgata]